MSTVGEGIDAQVDEYMRMFRRLKEDHGEEHAAGLVIASAMQERFKAEKVLEIVRTAHGIKEYDN
jgi:tRNA splicing endonuclease